MQIEIPSDQEPSVKRLALRAGFTTVEQYVLNLIQQEEERAAIQVGLDQAVRGEGRPIAEFDAEFRRQKGIPSSDKCSKS